MTAGALRMTALAVAAGLVLAACGGGTEPPTAGTASATATAAASPGTAEGGAVTIASGVTAQTRVIAHMYAQRLRDEGIAAEVVDLGTGRAALFDALKSGRADVVPDFTGDLYTYVREHEKSGSASPTPSPGSTAGPGLLGSLGALLGVTGETGPSGDDVYGALPDALPRGTRVLEQSSAENTDRFVVTEANAAKYELGDLTTVAKYCGKLKVGMPTGYAGTAQGTSGLRTYYDCSPRAAPEFPYAQRVTALLGNDVQAAVLPASAPEIIDDELTVLDDPHRLYRPERLVPVARTGLTDEAAAVINSTNNSVRTQDLTMITRLVSGGNPDMTPEQAAGFLLDQPR